MIQTKKFLIEGMHCGGCAASIEMLLSNQPGVKTAEVSFENGEATLELDDSEFNFQDVEALVKGMGYKFSERKDL